MKIGTYVNPNDKGQIVIPRKIRESLQIDSSVTLNIIQAGDGIYIYRVKEFITSAEGESSYLKLLEKTKGAWIDDSKKNSQSNKSKIELVASKKRKRIW